MLQKSIILNFLAQKNQEQLPLAKKERGKKLKRSKIKASSEEEGVVAEMYKNCTCECGEFGSFLKRKSNCNYRY